MNELGQDSIDDEMICTACDEDCDELYARVPDDRVKSVWLCVNCYAEGVE
jgi:hypothetical protein